MKYTLFFTYLGLFGGERASPSPKKTPFDRRELLDFFDLESALPLPLSQRRC